MSIERVIKDAVESLLRENSDARATFEAILKRGSGTEFSKAEIARALLGCLFEAHKGMPDRWPDVLRQLREGRATQELFPDALYDSGKQNA